MLKLLLIDTSSCKKEFIQFTKKHKNSVKFLANSKDFVNRTSKLLDSIEGGYSPPKKLAVNTTESLTLLNVNDIVRCESNRNYTFIYLVNKKKLIVSKTLMDFEDVLSKYNFLRIHKSHLINVNFMEKYMKSDGGYVVLMDGTKLPVAIRKKEYLFRELEKL
jgi:two-component system LytT family response regulator